MKYSLGVSNFLEELLPLPFYCFPLFLCTDPWGRLCNLSLLFFGILHSNEYIFPFLLCFSLLFFSQLFVRPPQTTILPFCTSFSWGWSWSLPPVRCYKPPSIVLQALYQIYISILKNQLYFNLKKKRKKKSYFLWKNSMTIWVQVLFRPF